MKRVLAVILAAIIGCMGMVSCAGNNDPVNDDDSYVVIRPGATQQMAGLSTASPMFTPQPSAMPTFNGEPTLYQCKVNSLNVRHDPSIESEIIMEISFGDTVNVVGEENGFYRIWFGGSKYGYCYKPYLVPAGEELYGYVGPLSEYKTDEDGNIVYESDGVTPIVLTAELVDIRLFVPNVTVYQIFGTTSNFTGEVLYDRSVPVLQRGTANKLARAAAMFAEDGYTIKIYDCYRPKSVQYILYDIVQNGLYIANPYTGQSNHNRAAAVDMTLIDSNGNELEFPTPMHTFNKQANRSSASSWTEEQRRNVEYMTSVMVACGFQTIQSEWWHFTDTDYRSYMVLDIRMSNIPMYTAAQLGFAP